MRRCYYLTAGISCEIQHKEKSREMSSRGVEGRNDGFVHSPWSSTVISDDPHYISSLRRVASSATRQEAADVLQSHCRDSAKGRETCKQLHREADTPTRAGIHAAMILKRAVNSHDTSPLGFTPRIPGEKIRASSKSGSYETGSFSLSTFCEQNMTK